MGIPIGLSGQPLEVVTSLVNMEIGQCIPCRYTAPTSGQVGSFSELGSCIATEIPITGSATPDGLFYFIKVDKGLLIADRVIQHSISWDILNTRGFIDGKVFINDITSQSQLIDDGHYGARNLAFDDTIGGYTSASWEADANDKKGWVGQDFGTQKIIKVYSISACTDYPANSPIDWTFEGSNDMTNWDVLDIQTGHSWVGGETKYFFIDNIQGYRYYRINVTNCGGTGYVIISEIEMSEFNIPCLIRSLSGGCGYADIDGNLTFTNKFKGAFPTNNEVDKYIINSDLNGKIVAGDNDVWHYDDMFSHCKETGVSGTWYDGKGNSNTVNNKYRVLRGIRNRTINPDVAAGPSSNSVTDRGFRPVLEYTEPDGSSKQTTLWY
jgi:hypothetical protein